MKAFSRLTFCLVIVASISYPSVAQDRSRGGEIIAPKDYTRLPLQDSAKLAAVLNAAIGDVVSAFPNGAFKNEEIAATLIDLRDPARPAWANIRGEEKIYPASVVKMFYMTSFERQLEDGKIKLTPEMQRGLHDMIVDSSNEATQYILDVLTDTSSGAELPQKEFDKWQYKRNRVNRYFASMGFQNINANQKTFCEDAYGIEQQSRNYKGQNRNMLTTNAVARLLSEIVTGRMNTPERTRAMMDLMKRDPFSPDSGNPEDQAHGFNGRLFIGRKMTDAKLWSKAGSTSKSWHDAAYIETADGLKFVLVIFTENHANDRDVIPTIAGKVIDGLRK